MSTRTFDDHAELVSPAKTGHGGNGGIGSTISAIIDALATACRAEAEYRKQIARGVSPATAASQAFKTSYKA